MRSPTRRARRGAWRSTIYKNKILEFIGACMRHKTPPKIKVHFLNTKFKSEVPGEDWSLGTMNVINSTAELRETFGYWADEIQKITPGLTPEEIAESKQRIAKLSTFKWNVVKVAPQIFFETYILDTWGNAFVDDNVVTTKVGYCSALTDHFAILCNGRHDLLLQGLQRQHQGRQRVRNAHRRDPELQAHHRRDRGLHETESRAPLLSEMPGREHQTEIDRQQLRLDHHLEIFEKLFLQEKLNSQFGM